MEGLRSLWAGDRVVLGAWLTLREPILGQVASAAGYDYTCLDMQHGFCSFSDAIGMLGAVASGPAVPIVRVPRSDHGVIERVLDAGALGVIVPMVETADDARRAVAACHYPPLGERSFGPHIARSRYGLSYFDRANGMITCLPMIETGKAVDNIEEIVAVPGIDGVYLGPADLAVSLGRPPAMDLGDPVVGPAITRVVTACRGSGVVVGVHCAPEVAADRVADGYRMLTVAGDLAPATRALQDGVLTTRRALETR